MRDIRQPFKLADAGEATGTSLSETTGHIWPLAVQVAGTFTATVKIQGRLHPDLPMVDLASVSAPGITLITVPVSDLQIDVTYVDGTVSAWFAGFNAQL